VTYARWYMMAEAALFSLLLVNRLDLAFLLAPVGVWRLIRARQGLGWPAVMETPEIKGQRVQAAEIRSRIGPRSKSGRQPVG
jgi:hypothetical protein